MGYDICLKATSPLGCTIAKYDMIISAPAEVAKSLRCSLPGCITSYDCNIIVRIIVLCNGKKLLPPSGCVDNSRFITSEIIPVDNHCDYCNNGRKEGVIIVRSFDPCLSKLFCCYPEMTIMDECKSLKLTILLDQKNSANPCECEFNRLVSEYEAYFKSIGACNSCNCSNNCSAGCGCGNLGCGCGNAGAGFFGFEWWIIILLFFFGFGGFGCGFGGFGGWF